jgi:hypothetical protein
MENCDIEEPTRWWDEPEEEDPENVIESSAVCAEVPRENCDQTVDRVTLVPEFNYMGCDDCMEEALQQIAREQERKGAQIERTQGTIIPEVA